jgi:uncharacterized membrane protein
MAPTTSLRLILAVALFGAAFSGYLTYRELNSNSVACQPLGSGGTILGYPPCVYGLVMYLAILAIAFFGLGRGHFGSGSDAQARGGGLSGARSAGR